MELTAFHYEVQYRPVRLNTADALRRDGIGATHSAHASSIVCHENQLTKLHREFCCPGITRMNHQVKLRNLPYSLKDVEVVCKSCPTCCELKPRFFKPSPGKIIRATQPFERLLVDFKSPLPTANNSGNTFILTVIDEFSRFPFVFPCQDTSTDSVIKCFNELFTTYGTPGNIHSDSGSSFKSKALKEYLTSMGINSTFTKPYHPQGNGHCQRFNGIIWKTVKLCANSHKQSIMEWESILPVALHSIHSLLCTRTNATPHERGFTFIDVLQI